MLTIRSLGHACYTLHDGTHCVILDPFLEGNPDAVCGPDEVQVDFILPTHGHADHLGDAVRISKAQAAPIVGVYELCAYCARQGAQTVPMHIGGQRQMPFGTIKLTPAVHGSAVISDDTIQYMGLACGFVVTMGQATVYFAGDTALFGDMALISRSHKLDVAILPIGDNFTMGIEDAAQATALLKPDTVIPTHYNAFEAIRRDAGVFAQRVGALSEATAGAQCRILDPGEEFIVSDGP